MARRQVLFAYNRQIRLLPEDLQRCECGLIEVGRQHARNFDAGHISSGTACHRVLTELRKLAAKHMASQAAETATPVHNELENIRARVAARLAVQDRERPPRGVTSVGHGREHGLRARALWSWRRVPR